MWKLRVSLSARGHRRKLATMLLGAVAMAACGWLFLPRTYSTEAGEWRTVMLSDGSVARLGPRTVIVVRYESGRRWIQQFSGEATYDVAKDPYRPFSVECGDVASVQAIGTKFAVRCDGHDINVVVAEGTVSVSRRFVRPDQVPSVDQVVVDAGHKVLVDQWTPLLPKPVDIDVALAWERGRVIFSGTPVEVAIAEFNRRHKQQIPMPSDSRKNARRLFGDFDLEDPEEFERHLKGSPAMQPAPKSK